MEIDMNKAQLTNLFETGAIFNVNTDQIFHPSFRKGFRKLRYSDMSWIAVLRAEGKQGTDRLIEDKMVYSFK
jgi:hypothetical protein